MVFATRYIQVAPVLAVNAVRAPLSVCPAPALCVIPVIPLVAADMVNRWPSYTPVGIVTVKLVNDPAGSRITVE